ncbi:hypothetical protein T265_03129 [Opisthorchis viverrini]|uniref:Uncharacterized protein n=1 Tax=Opisthorchis viverrini TaxID=6198 RepID=A0A074ZWU7_OPIVI|nr:hypothetical protein T265_03129 [Opisthorchis viverrini]KER30392.1 hypothetical protein T265_03129 [Opisthorchis viverrini]
MQQNGRKKFYSTCKGFAAESTLRIMGTGLEKLNSSLRAERKSYSGPKQLFNVLIKQKRSLTDSPDAVVLYRVGDDGLAPSSELDAVFERERFLAVVEPLFAGR